jgi:hypothetical protein
VRLRRGQFQSRQESFSLFRDVMHEVVAVLTEPGEVLERVVGAVLIERVDGQHADVGQAAELADWGRAGAEHRVAVGAFTALPVGVASTGSQRIAPGDAAAMVAEEQPAL